MDQKFFEEVLDGMSQKIDSMEAEIGLSKARKFMGENQGSLCSKSQAESIQKEFYTTGIKGETLPDFMERKNLNTGSGSGGSTIQEVVSAELIKQAILNQQLLTDCGLRSVPNGSPLTIPVLLQRPTVEQTTENVSGVEPTETQGALFGSVSADFAKTFSKPVFTNEIVQDSVIDVVAETNSMVSEEYGYHFINQMLFGAKEGSTDPLQLRGILTDRVDAHNSYTEALEEDELRDREFFKVIKTGVNGALPNANQEALIDFLIDVQTDLSHEYQDGAKWYMTKKTFGILRKLKRSEDGSDISGLLSMDYGTLNNTFMLLGKPIVIVDQMPELDGSTVSCPIIYGNLMESIEFVTVSGSDITVIDPYSVKGTVAYYNESRFGSVINNFDALKVVLASV